MGDMFFRLFILIMINMVVSVIVSLLVPNTYLASMITSVILAFFCTAYNGQRKEKYKTEQFWSSFFFLAIIFLLIDLILWMIG